MADPLLGSLTTLTIDTQSIADNKWHYNCTDLSPAVKASSRFSKYSLTLLKVYQVSLLEFKENFKAV